MIGKEKIEAYYRLRIWDEKQMKEAVALGEITETDYAEIMGEGYVPLPQEQTENIWDEMDRAYREGVNSL